MTVAAMDRRLTTLNVGSCVRLRLAVHTVNDPKSPCHRAKRLREDSTQRIQHNKAAAVVTGKTASLCGAEELVETGEG